MPILGSYRPSNSAISWQTSVRSWRTQRLMRWSGEKWWQKPEQILNTKEKKYTCYSDLQNSLQARGHWRRWIGELQWVGYYDDFYLDDGLQSSLKSLNLNYKLKSHNPTNCAKFSGVLCICSFCYTNFMWQITRWKLRFYSDLTFVKTKNTMHQKIFKIFQIVKQAHKPRFKQLLPLI